MIRKMMWAAALCGALFLAGCGAREKAVMAPVTQPEQAAQQEPAVVEITGNQPSDPNAALSPPPGADAGSVSIVPLDSGASADESDPDRVVISGGCVEITVDQAAFDRAIAVEDGASLRLVLQNGATFSGALTWFDLRNVYVSLDMTSVWSLAGDTAVGSIVNQDTSFSNVHSNGFALDYDSESAHNAYLAGAAKQLPGGGFLTPII